MPEHVDTCVYDKLRGFFARYDERCGLLEAENQLLRTQITSMATELDRLQHQLSASLGPYMATRLPEHTKSSSETEIGDEVLSTEAPLSSHLSYVSTSLHDLTDSVARMELRTERQIMNESLRQSEELHVLRAGLHGVRMQVCQLLLDHQRSTAPLAGVGVIRPPFVQSASEGDASASAAQNQLEGSVGISPGMGWRRWGQPQATKL